MTVKNWFAEFLAALLEVAFPKKKHSVAAQKQGAEVITRRIRPTHRRGHLTFLPYRDSAVKHFLYAIKYERHRESIILAADIFWNALYETMQEEEVIHAMRYALCTVPATSERSARDGYNHLHTILDVLYTHTPNTESAPADKRNLLTWNRPVSRQSSMKNQPERYRNVNGAMAVTEQIPPNTICFVIDDITTTGSTLTEARRTLTANGAHTVITLALAH